MKRTIFVTGFLILLVPRLLLAQHYPAKPVNILVGFAPGGSVDTVTRTLASKAEKFLGQPFAISNNSGGGGSVGLGIVAKERPDGYHLAGCTSTGLTMIPQLRTVPYKLEDFIPIIHFASMQTGLVVRADSPWKSFKELVDFARTNPGAVTYGTAGAGTTVHMAMEYVAKQEKIQWTHVPYMGALPAVTALLGGHIHAASCDTTWMPHVKDGKLRLLVTYEEKRMKAFPDVPTLKDLGYDFINVTMFIIATPKGTPPSVVKKLYDAFRKGMDDPEFIQTMGKFEYEVASQSSEDVKKQLEDTQARFQRIITELKIPRQVERK